MGLDECTMHDMVGTMLVYGCMILMNMNVLNLIIRKNLQCLHSFSLSLKMNIERDTHKETHREGENMDIADFFLYSSIQLKGVCDVHILSLSFVRDKYIDTHT
jgi:hypothetical protein